MRTHALRRPSEEGAARGTQRNTHTHTIYAVRRLYSAGAQWFYPSPVAPVGLSDRHSRRVRTPPPQTHPHPSPNPPSECPQISQLAQAARACGGAQCPPEWRGHTVYGRHGACVTCRAAHRRDQRRGYAQARLRAPGEQDRRVRGVSLVPRPQVKRMLVPSALRTVCGPQGRISRRRNSRWS